MRESLSNSTRAEYKDGPASLFLLVSVIVCGSVLYMCG